MVTQRSLGFACLLQLLGTGTALPLDQSPLRLNAYKNVQAIREKLQDAEIIPTVIDDFTPSLTLSVMWSEERAKLGNTISPEYLEEQPAIALHDDTSPDGRHADSDMSYVVTLTDPDAPSRDNPEWSEMCHWITSNVTISPNTFNILPLPEFGLVETEASKDGSPDDVIGYKPPGPPPKTGKHRYVFLVFAPKNGTTEPLDLSKPEDRQHWGTGKEGGGGAKEWAEENGLVPVAANFIYSENEEQ
ncbi:PEBP-like protein [Decorospora gaudefroyi]|uniref:PEBP-like protein n=1 Tax=Decorospora gaudefroyi TaxID=184978 RepID=A0A6A5K1T1_9PLEO|nr:PEBP-like protein [Decorospora gaudefroyi]